MDPDSMGKTAIAVPSERPKGPGKPCLLVIAGPGIGTQYDLGDSVLDIGRQEDCTISIASSKVSRRHASVQRILGRYNVADLGSTNGTYVNGDRIDKVHQLVDGDKIKIGELVLKYVHSRIELQYHQQILEMATTDALTGAQNKRAFDDTLPPSVLKSVSDGVPLSLMLFDVDHFKKINDTYGHAAGDAVLKQLGTLALEQLAGHRVFRVGGEEFAVLMDSLGREAALASAERFRASVQAATFEHQATHIPVTISVGLAELSASEAANTLYQRADEQLYASKRSGRNRISG